jgi:sec-independent protein translocase protein TatC
MSVGTEPEPKREEDEQEGIRGGQMSFLDHLEELRQRILRSLIAVAVSFGVCFWFKEKLYQLIERPIRSVVGPLSFSQVTEPFNLLIKISFVGALFLSAPFIMAQIWLFISPGLYKHERRYALPFIISSSLLFVIGGMFAYFVAFPFAVQFLVGIGTADLGLHQVIMASDYFDLFLTVIVCLGIVFQIPAIIFILARIGLVSGSFLLRNTRYALLISAIVAAVITPTSDIPNMMVIMIPMMMLYLLGVGVAFLFGKKRKKED